MKVQHLGLFLAALALPLTGMTDDLLIKFKDPDQAKMLTQSMMSAHPTSQAEDLGFNGWVKLKAPEGFTAQSFSAQLQDHPAVAYVQPDYKIQLLNNYKLKDPALRQKLAKHLEQNPELLAFRTKDNPPLPKFPVAEAAPGADPEVKNQWGMMDIGAEQAWKKTTGSREMVVAVIDTGVDYNHEDLMPNMWNNPGETGLDSRGEDKATNGVDDDENGYIDDVVGWDFSTDDNKPWDMYASTWRIFLGGGNPGHGTHCAGNIAARGNNSLGIAGVAPNVRIMALRFIGENGQGTTSAAIKSITYAIQNGAMITSNSWGSSGEDASDPEGNKALREVITESEKAGTLFVAAAGNSTYDNDSGSSAAYPASYPNENIISVAAIDSENQLGSFSSYGANTVDLGAPGVKVFSTVPDNRYQDTIGSFLGLKVYWDGTSMAAPHVAGAAAWYWSLHPELTALEVKRDLLNAVEPVPALKGRTLTGGKLNLKSL